MASYYPPVAFYFSVEFNLLTSVSNVLNVNNLENNITGLSRNFAANIGVNAGDSARIDTSFQEVAGLKATVQVRELSEGGENRFKHYLPEKVTFEKLVLKRGIVKDSAVLQWCLNAIANFEFKPVTLLIKLMDLNHEAVMTWEVVNAYPVGWAVGAFNAEQNGIAIEEMTLAYQYFNVKLE